ncbi:WhiB family transcriptional regulator [Rhodococcus opacus]|uniref:WhiB family transcriptional regulator n=1 Tax=Rhodococcus opacus TaxID=37919 RepID=UPI0022364CD7|nr:WhiB family transcriptional regulator [Rhodococcus opacus]UZG60506.1 WhiB family transcriptional regulator [Rhodococcus opacus]
MPGAALHPAQEAIAFCRVCPVIDNCRRDAAHASNPTGVWAGEIYPDLDRRARREVRPLSGHRTRTVAPVAHSGWDAADVTFTDLIATIRAQRAARAACSENPEHEGIS